jgi:hypothetical protein
MAWKFMNRTIKQEKNIFIIGIKTWIRGILKSCEKNQKLFKPYGEICHQIRKTNIKLMHTSIRLRTNNTYIESK